MQAVGVIKHWNPASSEVILKLSFLDNEAFSDIEELVEEQKPVNIKIGSRQAKEQKTLKQLKRVWLMFSEIVLSTEEPLTAENRNMIEEYCRQTLYPRKTLHSAVLDKAVENFGTLTMDEPVRLSGMSIEQLNATMKRIEETWPEIFQTEKWMQNGNV
jgi:hypothetical protein